MPPIVLELQHDALDRNVPVSDLLRKALVVAKKLHLLDFQRWVEDELAGYRVVDEDQMPLYRELHGMVKALNPYRGWVPVISAKDAVNDRLSRRRCAQSVPELESLVASTGNSDTLQMPFAPELRMRISKAIGWNVPVTLEIQRASLVGVLDAVRTTVLNWALKLEEDGILGEALSFSEKEKERAQSLPSSVANFYGPVEGLQLQQGAVSSFQISIDPQLDPAKLKELLDLIRSLLPESNIPSEDDAQVKADLATIDSQLSSPKPRASIISEALQSIRSTLESAAGSALYAALPKLNELLASFF